MTNMIKTKDAKKGGYLVGKPHSEGGIKGINVDTNQPIEVEGGEVVITKPAVESNETYNLDGVEMKPREILSKINSDHGGVKFQQGGEIDNTYDTGGEIVKNEQKLVKKFNAFGVFYSTVNKRPMYCKITKISYQIEIYVKGQGFIGNRDVLNITKNFNTIFQVGDFVYINPFKASAGNKNGWYGDGESLFSDPSPFTPWQVTELIVLERKSGDTKNSDQIAMIFYKVYEELGQMKEAKMLLYFDDFYNTDEYQKYDNIPKIQYEECNVYIIKNIGNTRVPFDENDKDENGFPIVYPPFKNKYVTSDAGLIGQLGFLSGDVVVGAYRFTFDDEDSDKNELLYINLDLTKDSVKSLKTQRFKTESRDISADSEFIMVGDYVRFKTQGQIIENPLVMLCPEGSVYHSNYHYFNCDIPTAINVNKLNDSSVLKDSVEGIIIGFKITNKTSSSGSYYGWNVARIYLLTPIGNIIEVNPTDYAAEKIVFDNKGLYPISPQFWEGKDPSGKPAKKTRAKTTPSTPHPTPPATPATPAEILEAEIQAKKKKDESDALKYELLLDALEMEETKLIVMRAVATDNPVRLKEIDRKLEEIARKKGEYALKKDTSLDLLDKLQDAVEAEKFTAEAREYNLGINGQQSELTPSQYTKVRTENFMDWFGNWIEAYELYDYTGVSKVINPRTSEPLVLYHGTDKDFKEWTFDQFPAAYFADNLSYSEWFAGQKSTGGNGEIYEVFLSLKNPIDLRMYGTDEITMKEIFSHLETEYKIKANDFLPVLKTLDATALDRALKLKLKVWQFVRKTTGFINYLKNETFFDGILMFEDNPDDRIGGIPNTTGSYVAFHTSQIKWSTAKYFNPAIGRNDFALGGAV